ncbi:MAG: hypothetical protein OXO52_12000 [Rhodospirillales bacterium]|nr:hypothetical protein [Rhodospirillales bacterium]MDE0379110.1 hypothetical protein [Rhodospirillales bacterium]
MGRSHVIASGPFLFWHATIVAVDLLIEAWTLFLEPEQAQEGGIDAANSR